jgi:hypothetical protein
LRTSGGGFTRQFSRPRILQDALIILLDPARLILGPMASDKVVEAAAREMGLRTSLR